MVARLLDELFQSLPKEVDVGGLIARNAIAHKWKATYRSLALRELVYWRLYTLLRQCFTLSQSQMILGARVLLRSAIETLCVLIYLNKKTREVVSGKSAFKDFDEITGRLIVGAKDRSPQPEPINILTIIDQSDKRYPGIKGIYLDLCETAHPNYTGMSQGFSTIKHEEYITEFGDFWSVRFGDQHLEGIKLCIIIFKREYNEEWIEAFDALEGWLVSNDQKLEMERKSNPSSQ